LLRNTKITEKQIERNRKYLKAEWLRELLQETRLTPQDLVQPLFLHNKKDKEKISALSGQFRHSLQTAITEIKLLKSLGIKAVSLFPYIEQTLKDEQGSYALNKNNFIYRYISEIKNQVPDIGLICDVALDPYTAHGHDGVLYKKKNTASFPKRAKSKISNEYNNDFDNNVDNDTTIEILAEQAFMLAKAGADIVAPSDMMDGRVHLIREVLDSNDLENTLICSYSAKFASCFYSPFRSAIGSDKNLKKADKKTYQLNPANANNAIAKSLIDTSEGADILIVKPATLYLDIINKVKVETKLPVFAYHVSGEYALLKTAAEQGIVDYHPALHETLISIKRSGADAIITYGAKDFASKL